MTKIDLIMWVVAAAAVVGTVANVYQRWWGFAIWMLTNVAWVIFNIHIKAYHQAVLMALYAALAAWGLVKWKTETGKKTFEERRKSWLQKRQK